MERQKTHTLTWWRIIGNKAKTSTAKHSKANTSILADKRDPSSTDAKMAALSDTGALSLGVDKLHAQNEKKKGE